MKFWSYIQAHHEELGSALFVLPMSLVGLVIVGVASALTKLLG